MIYSSRTISIFSAAIFAGLLSTNPVLANSDIEGIWVLERITQNADVELTDSGEQIAEAYNLLTDDPSLNCVPASLGRIYANPNSRFEIIFGEDSVEIDFELFDLRRSMAISNEFPELSMPSTVNLAGQHFAEMGVSRAEIQTDSLLIETLGYAPGFVRTSSGLPQGNFTQSTERFYREADKLMLELTYRDSSLYQTPFTIIHRFARATVDSLPLYECTEPDYDWFEELNNSAR